MATITNLEAAHRQLVTAIRLYFEDGDIAAIHTLACAAREIFEKHCRAAGVERMFDYIAVANPHKTPNELWNILNGVRNFLKHPEASLDLSASIELEDQMNAMALFIACHDCAQLCEREQPTEVQAFNMWFLATRFPVPDPVDLVATQEFERAKVIESQYPGLREAPLAEQKRAGKQMIIDAIKLLATTSPDQR